MKVWQTLYKTDVPDQLDRAEYYQPMLVGERINGAWVYFVRETHAWYQEGAGKPYHKVTTLNPEEGFTSYEEWHPF